MIRIVTYVVIFRYQSTLETTRESPSASSAEVTASSLVLNPSDDLLKTPDLTGENGTKLRKKSAPSPSNKRVLTQEEFDKYLITIINRLLKH